MKAIVIVAHPDKKSFNHVIAETAAEALHEMDYSVIFHDLYSEKFDALLPSHEILKSGKLDSKIIKYCDELISADGIIFVHPNWWGQPPAILKGYIDRVFRPGIAYEFEEGDSGEGIPIGLLKGKTGLVFNTSNTLQEREISFFGDPLDLIWKKCLFEFCGITHYQRKMFNVIVTSTLEQRQKWLEETGETVAEYFQN